MGILDRFEKGVEGVVNNAFGKFGSSKDLQPVDLSSALEKEIDDKAVPVGREHTVAPNVYHIYLSTYDFDRFFDRAQVIADELAQHLKEYAESQSYALMGEVSVILHEDAALEQADYRISSESVERKSASRRAAEPSAPSDGGYTPYVEINGQQYKLNNPRTLIGRNPDCDIIVNDTSVSRHHLTITLTPQGAIMEEVRNSKGQAPTNGTFVENHKLSAATLSNGNSIRIGNTVITYWDPEGVWAPKAQQ